jgi:uncharacterized protein YyaL (SSP411 family)
MLVDAVLDEGALPDLAGAASVTSEGASPAVFRAPGGGDPVLRAQGLAVELDPSEGAYPSGTSATASAALLLHTLTAVARYRDAALAALAPLAAEAVARPISFGATLELLSRLARPAEQLVLIEPDAGPVPGSRPGTPEPYPPRATDDPDVAMQAEGLRAAVRMWSSASLVAVATESEARMLAEGGFELFADRGARAGHPTAYLCHDFVCRLPATSASALSA